jgi:hypothetical protein
MAVVRMPLASFIDTLDKHQGTSTAVLTAVLVIVTIYYAAQNHAMVKEMKRARDAALLPKLALDFHRLGPTAMTIGIKNVGPGAALDIDVRTLWDPIAAGTVPERRWRRSILVPGEQADFMPPGETLNDSLNSLPARYNRVRLVGTMKDAARKAHTVNEVFDDLAEWRDVLASAHQRFTYPDAERRLAEELDKKFKGPLADLGRGIDNVAASLTALAPQQQEDDEQ